MDELLLDPRFRPESAGGPTLGEREVHVWAVPLSGSVERYQPLLSAPELARLERLRFLDHRRRFVLWHGALRSILAGYCGVDPAALAFRQGPRGKPYLDGQRFHFNLSHSGQLAMVAVGHDELGVDCEKVRHLESQQDIARRHFSAAEFAALAALQPDEQLRGFYRCWTRKEAFIKAVGAGLSMPLDVFDVSIDDRPRFLGFRDSDECPERWTLADVSPHADYAAALAARRQGWVLRTFALQPL